MPGIVVSGYMDWGVEWVGVYVRTVALHLGGLGYEVGAELPVADPEDRVEGEHFAGAQGTF